ncbi:MAG: SulP family inorganic anion transporter [Flavobacteriales bacterium]
MKTNELPKRGIEGLKAHFKDDLISGFSVSLIALPLCLGIAIASGVPPIAGLIAAIVGGLLASRISGTFVTISGPAAGLIVITLGAVEAMDYPNALGAVVIGGIIMALFGFLKVGKVGDYFPPAAVHGMLSAIGIIIIIKQFFPAIGVPSPKGEILEVASEMPHALTQFNPYALSMAILTLAILIIHPILKVKLIKLIPAPMWVLVFSIPAAILMGTEKLAMVEMPRNLFGEGGLELPSFTKIGESAFWIAVAGFALVSAIESLLSAKAVDSLDPYKRSSNLNKDLVSMGLGSSASAAIGGLPMISEIVRSSANVNNGAKTQWANFFHGGFLLIYLLIGAVVIEMIPISALAAMLVYTGFKLASPKEFKHMLQIGLMELLIFVVTIIAVLATDLIIGIVIGILFKYILILFKGTKINELFKSHSEIKHHGTVKTISLKGAQIFSNYLSLKKMLDSGLENFDKLILDFKNVSFVDHTVMNHLEECSRIAKTRGLELQIENLDQLHPISNHPLAARSRTRTVPLTKKESDPRSLLLESFSEEKGYKFAEESTNYGTWQFYHLTIRKEILSINNVIKLGINQVSLEIADITTKLGALTTEDIEEQTVLKMEGLKNVPKFYLQPSSFVDKIKETLLEDDINFDDHSDFSKRYTLKSDRMEKEVIEFFNEKLIALIEEGENYHLSGNGKALMLHLDEKLLDPKEIEELIAIGQKIIRCLEE